jgi:hypothetical protein
MKRTHQVLGATAQNLVAQEFCIQYHKQPSKSMAQFPRNLRRLSSYITQKENICVKQILFKVGTTVLKGWFSKEEIP